MNKQLVLASIAAALVVITAPAAEETKSPTAAPPHWDYGKEHGPTSWGTLNTDWAICATGRHQSPIDLPSKPPEVEAQAESKAATVNVAHGAHLASVLNNGHTVQVGYAGADTLAVSGRSYTLTQYHFHSPSEHTILGKNFPMEMHLVHQSKEGKLAVIGVLITEGKANAAFDPVWSKLPKHEGDDLKLGEVKVDVDQLLPARRAAYHYDGSLTTPPCSEGVEWLVMQQPIELSAAQIRMFRDVIEGNNRPTQPRNDRVVAGETVAYK